MPRILVLRHRDEQKRKKCKYLIDMLADAWLSRGLDVSNTYGVGARPEADLVIPNVDLTRRPRAYDEYLAAYPRVVNREVVDVAKRGFSEHLLCEGDDYAGPAIVKTDANFGGRPERWVRTTSGPWPLRLVHRVLGIIEDRLVHDLGRKRVLLQYPIYESFADVPRGAFHNPALVVEKFLPEREGECYFTRHYLFLGNRYWSVRLGGTDVFPKRENITMIERDVPVPSELIVLRSRLGFDFGKFDFTIHDGAVVILDVNATPSSPGGPEATQAVSALADGIWSFLD